MKFNKLILTGLCCIIALFSCKKDDNQNIGAELIDNPNDLSSVVKNDFSFITYSKIQDTVITSGFDEVITGSINSQEGGLGNSRCFITLLPDSFDRTFPASDFYIDYFNLQVDIEEIYGNSASTEFEVFATNGFVDAEGIYYHFDSISLGDQIGSFTLGLSDTGVISIPLDSAMATKLMTANPAYYANADAFVGLFPGICIKPKNESIALDEGAIYNFNSDNTKISFGFKTTNGMDNVYDNDMIYNVTSNKYTFSNFTHDFTGSTAKSIEGDSTLGQNSFIAQGMAGGHGKIEFPDFAEWYNSDTANYLLNNFRITFSPVTDNVFELPDTLVISYKISETSSNQEQFVVLNNETSTYSVEIPSTRIADALNIDFFDKMNFTLRIPYQRESGEIVEIHGPSSASPPILEVIATKF